MRGTPHVQSMVCISNEEDSITAEYVSSDKDEHLRMVKDLINKTVTAKLTPRINKDDLDGSPADIS
jgi:hypothetical protein